MKGDEKKEEKRKIIILLSSYSRLYYCKNILIDFNLRHAFQFIFESFFHLIYVQDSLIDLVIGFI